MLTRTYQRELFMKFGNSKWDIEINHKVALQNNIYFVKVQAKILFYLALFFAVWSLKCVQLDSGKWAYK